MDPLLKKTTLRFLSFSSDKDDKDQAEKEAKLKEAASTIEKAIARERALDELVDYQPPSGEETGFIDPSEDTRPLFERLLEQKNKKKEALEDAQKLSNLVSTLDEEDISHLNEMARNKREEEIRRRLEISDALENKKRLDEQRALEEAKAKRESLLNLNNIKKDSQIKSRLSSMMKIKPKNKQQPKHQESNTPGPTTSNIDEEHPQNESVKRPNDECDQDESATKKPALSTTDPTVQTPDEGPQGTNNTPDCSCVKNVTTCIGILPSLPITSKACDSSDDSDNSNHDHEPRIVPRVRRR